MQLYPILLVAVILAADDWHRGQTWIERIPPGVTLAAGPGAIGLIVIGAWIATAYFGRRISRKQSVDCAVAAERIAIVARGAVMAVHITAVLGLGWLQFVRSAVGDWILLDELLVIAPAIAGLVATWWIYYPIDCRLREALLVRNLDQGTAVHPIPSRWRYVLLHARLGILFLLVPVLLIAGLAEAMTMLAAPAVAAGRIGSWVIQLATMAAALAVFVFAPFVALWVLDVKPIRDAALREDLMAVPLRHGVRVRELLLWNTSGMMINAAVMGLLGRLRYVLLTDALLEVMSRQQLHAVMAHEIAHVKCKHLIWLVLVLMACICLAIGLIEIPVSVFLWTVAVPTPVLRGIEIAAAVMQIAIVFYLFGWVSRKFERQADTFAVEHLSAEIEEEQRRAESQSMPETVVGGDDGTRPRPADLKRGRVQATAVDSMAQSLAIIARLNAIPLDRPSWRHGSIRWRREYLRSLEGSPRDQLRIHQQVRGVKAAAAFVLLASIAASFLLADSAPDGEQADLQLGLIPGNVCNEHRSDES